MLQPMLLPVDPDTRPTGSASFCVQTYTAVKVRYSHVVARVVIWIVTVLEQENGCSCKDDVD